MHSMRQFVLLSLVSCVVVCVAQPGSWTQLYDGGKDMPQALAFASVATDAPRNRILYFGGASSTFFTNNNTNELWSFNPINAEWELLTPSGDAPKARTGHSAIIYSDKMYIFGGFDGNQSTFNDMWSYDLVGNAWAQVQYGSHDEPIPRSKHAAVLVGSQMWIFGGNYGTYTDIGDAWVFDFGALVWSERGAIQCPPTSYAEGIGGGPMAAAYYQNLNTIVLNINYWGMYEYNLTNGACAAINITGAVQQTSSLFFYPTFALTAPQPNQTTSPILYIFGQIPFLNFSSLYSNFYAYDHDKRYMAVLPIVNDLYTSSEGYSLVTYNNSVYVTIDMLIESYGSQFYTPGCQNNCSGVATCVQGAYCACEYHTRGSYDCSAICEPACMTGFCDYTNSGDPTSGYDCKCTGSVVGPLCEYACPDCNNHGTCIMNDFYNATMCNCENSYYGDTCADTCPGAAYCSFHGTCESNLTCSCLEFWTGVDCSVDARTCYLPQLQCIENNTTPMSDISWCSNQNVFIAPIKFQSPNNSINATVKVTCDSEDPNALCRSISQVSTVIASSKLAPMAHDEYVLMGINTGDILVFDFNTEQVIDHLYLGPNSVQYLQGWADFVQVVIAADNDHFVIWQYYPNKTIMASINETWAQDPDIGPKDQLVSVQSFIDSQDPILVPEAVVFQVVVVAMFQNSATGQYKLQYRQYMADNFTSWHADQPLFKANTTTWSIATDKPFDSLNFYFTEQYSVGTPYGAQDPECSCGYYSRRLLVLYSDNRIAIYTIAGMNLNIQSGSYILPFNASTAIYNAPGNYSIMSVVDFSSCCADTIVPSETRHLVVGLHEYNDADSVLDIVPLKELAIHDFTCATYTDSSDPQYGLVMKREDGICSSDFQNCGSNDMYYNGSTCVSRTLHTMHISMIPLTLELQYVSMPSGSAVDEDSFLNIIVENSTVSSAMQSFEYNVLFIAGAEQALNVWGIQPASCGEDLNIVELNTIDLPAPIIDFVVTGNGQHVFIASAKSYWELSSRLQLVTICEKIKSGDTSPFLAPYQSYCVPPLGPPQPLGFGDFLFFVSMCNSGRYCPSFQVNEINVVAPGLYTYMPGKIGPCIPQYYCPEGQLEICPVGYKCPNSGMLLPIRCERNPYLNTTCYQQGLADEMACPNGTICLTMDTSPIPAAPGYFVFPAFPLPPGFECGEGSFCPLGASAPPPLCPAGFYCPNASIIEPIECPTMFNGDGQQIHNKTSYCPDGTIAPAPCPAGFYCSLPNQLANCTNGDYCPEGTQVPAQCPRGQYCPTPSKVHKCPEGHFCPAGTTNPFKCSIFEICPAGAAAQRQWTILAAELIILLFMFIGFRVYLSCVRSRHDKKFVEAHASTPGVDKKSNRFKKAPRESDALLPMSSKRLQNQGFLIQFEDLRLTVGKNKEVLRGVSGTFVPGRLTAIMGPSGAGKTTTLQVLSGRVSYTGGTLTINGRQGDMQQYRTVFGFVPQEDIMHRTLTVKEILEFSTAARLPPSVTKKERTLLIMDILDVLGLSHVRYSQIGDDETRGLSGGERKRVNIAMELAAEPYVLFLDEPTSGLDSTSATQVMQCLKNVADMGITVVCVIHQPRVEVFEMIDNVLLLGLGGVTVYQGEANKAISYFTDVLQFEPKKESTNPADYLMDAISGKIPRANETVAINDVWTQRTTPRGSTSINNNFGQFKPRKMPNALYQLLLFIHRSATLIFRDMYSVVLNLSLVFVSGLMAGFVYSSNSEFIGPMSPDEQARCPSAVAHACSMPINDSYVIQFCLLNMAAGMTAVASSLRHFGDERVIYWREATTGTSSLAYFIGKNVASIPLLVICPLVLLSIYYMLVALQHNFWMMYVVLLLTQFACVGAGHLISLLIAPNNALLAGVVYVIVSTLFSGANPALSKLNSYGVPAMILTSLSYSRWSTEGLYILSLLPYKNVYNLDTAFDFWGYKRNYLFYDLMGLLALGILFRILAFGALIVLHKNRKAK